MFKFLEHKIYKFVHQQSRRQKFCLSIYMCIKYTHIIMSFNASRYKYNIKYYYCNYNLFSINVCCLSRHRTTYHILLISNYTMFNEARTRIIFFCRLSNYDNIYHSGEVLEYCLLLRLQDGGATSIRLYEFLGLHPYTY